MRQVAVLKRTKPLFFDGDNLIVCKGQSVYSLDESLNAMKLFDFEAGLLNKITHHSRLLCRARRAGIRCAARFEGFYVFVANSQLTTYTLTTGQMRTEHKFYKGKGPITLSSIDGIGGFTDGIYFGDYFSNDEKAPTSIYRRKPTGEWHVVYTFSQGQVNHIHSIIPDPSGDCVWILTGDFGDAAAIWRATDDFTQVRPVVSGEQKFRACVAFPLDNGLLYATDTQFERNSIRLLHKVDNQWQSDSIFQINGPCIYGCELNDYFVFSTATEPNRPDHKRWLSLLDNRPGSGVIRNQSDIIVYRKSDQVCTVIRSNKKDTYPYRLFQFGAIMFPGGKNSWDKICAYNVANRMNDLSTEILEL